MKHCFEGDGSNSLHTINPPAGGLALRSFNFHIHSNLLAIILLSDYIKHRTKMNMKNILLRLKTVVFFFLYGGWLLFSIFLGFSLDSFWNGLLSIAVGWLIIDILNLALSYIIEGEINFERSILYLIFRNNNKNIDSKIAELQDKRKQAIEKSIPKIFPYVSKIVNSDLLSKIFEFDYEFDDQMSNAQKTLKDIYERTGKDENFFYSPESFTLNYEILEDQYNALNQSLIAKVYKEYITQTIGSMVSINHKLDKGLSLEKGYLELRKKESKNIEEFLDKIKNMAISFAASIINLKNKKSGADMSKVIVQKDELLKISSEFLSKHITLIKSIMINPELVDKNLKGRIK